MIPEWTRSVVVNGKTYYTSVHVIHGPGVGLALLDWLEKKFPDREFELTKVGCYYAGRRVEQLLGYASRRNWYEVCTVAKVGTAYCIVDLEPLKDEARRAICWFCGKCLA